MLGDEEKPASLGEMQTPRTLYFTVGGDEESDEDELRTQQHDLVVEAIGDKNESPPINGRMGGQVHLPWTWPRMAAVELPYSPFVSRDTDPVHGRLCNWRETVRMPAER